jgi:hypothetical protein
VANDQVVQHVDVKQLAGGDDRAGHQHILGAGAGVPEGWLWATISAALLWCTASFGGALTNQMYDQDSQGEHCYNEDVRLTDRWAAVAAMAEVGNERT